MSSLSLTSALDDIMKAWNDFGDVCKGAIRGFCSTEATRRTAAAVGSWTIKSGHQRDCVLHSVNSFCSKRLIQLVSQRRAMNIILISQPMSRIGSNRHSKQPQNLASCFIKRLRVKYSIPCQQQKCQPQQTGKIQSKKPQCVLMSPHFSHIAQHVKQWHLTAIKICKITID